MNNSSSQRIELEEIKRATRGGVPLDDSLRVAMESRFGRSLASVRINCDEAAATLTQRVQARALTVGRNILFGFNQFRPRTPEGRRLLAHELAHVLQQASHTEDRFPAMIGPADDLWEREAEAAARQIDTNNAMPTLTSDRSGYARRVQLDVSSVGIDIAVGSAKPSVSLHDQSNQQEAAFHLTRGFNTATLNPNDSEVGDPINFIGHVKLKATEQELKNSRFGFIQVVKVSPLFFIYQGRKPDEGHIVVDLGLAMGNDFILDADQRAANRSFLPFYRTNQPQIFDDEVSVGMRDHPFFRIPLKTMNFKTGFENFLMSVDGGFDFFSTCAFQDPNKKLTPLAHVHWQIVHSRRFVWKGGQIVESVNASNFPPPGAVEKGPPKDKSASTKTIGGSLAPIGNDVFKAALRQVGDRSSGNRFEKDGKHDRSPVDFFT